MRHIQIKTGPDPSKAELLADGKPMDVECLELIMRAGEVVRLRTVEYPGHVIVDYTGVREEVPSAAESVDNGSIYIKAMKLWGLECQLSILQEECAEVIQAVSKMRRGGAPRVVLSDKLAEEIADVEILITQLRETGWAEVIDHHRKLKHDRLIMRVRKAMEGQDGAAPTI